MSVACAQDTASSTPCISGDVPAYDYAEIDARFTEVLWDSSAGVSLQSSTALELSVVDLYGTSVCAPSSDTTRCTFSQRTGELFTIKVDNSRFSSPGRYRLCAF